MNDVPVLLALTAGMVAALNPCGFALLPAYLTLVVAQGGDDASRSSAVGRALTMSGAMTAGFVAVFGAFGLIAVPLALSLERYLPWATIIIGFALVGLGIYLLTGRELLLSTPKVAGPPQARRSGRCSCTAWRTQWPACRAPSARFWRSRPARSVARTS
jgi:cytochrome c biogenesis protein CcdA